MMAPFLSALRLLVRLLLAALFLTAGTLHCLRPAIFLLIMPPWIPFHRFCVEVSGILELLGGAGLLIPNQRVQGTAGLGLALLLVAVFPANIYMAMAGVQIQGIPSWLSWARLPVQPLLIAAVLWVTRDWPEKCSNSPDCIDRPKKTNVPRL
jgi:uncharacterized membrane protein